ncbi:Lrp/AsnC family transcriptional regulator [Streptomyces sp. NPDC007084]|uniref:Lrp/AsnC family transcriptional regulator n=1 Tax=Streptomyces sp. NPDC007084 TaxID=3154313 RepID=UPI00345319CB
MPRSERIDPTDARLLLALSAHPRATTVALAEASGLSRNTVQARLAALDRSHAVDSFERRVDPAALGYPLAAFVTTRVAQRRLDEVARALAAIPEVVQVDGLSGETDLLVHVVATGAEDLYRVAENVLGIPGVERTSTSLVMRRLVPYRIAPLLRRRSSGG